MKNLNLLKAATPNEADFVDTETMLQRLPISRRTLATWRMSGKIPSIKVGRRVLFCWENVSEALRRLERGGAS
jgi:predicted site-specific integrase-resolvase